MDTVTITLPDAQFQLVAKAVAHALSFADASPILRAMELAAKTEFDKRKEPTKETKPVVKRKR